MHGPLVPPWDNGTHPLRDRYRVAQHRKEAPVPRQKIDPAISRKAYQQAEAILKQNHYDEFQTLVDEAYAAQGVDSPRVRRKKVAEAADEKRLLAAQKRERAAKARLEAAAALLREAGVEVALPFADTEDAA